MNTDALFSGLRSGLHPIVPFDSAKDKAVLLDFTDRNRDLTAEVLEDTARFCGYIDERLRRSGARYGVGGYLEHRTVYSRSKVFGDPETEEPRRLHLGVDIWGQEGTEVFAPLDGVMHSFAFNDRFGDYGATLIVKHQIREFVFHTLYGHLSVADLESLGEGQPVRAGQIIAHFGPPKENGHWPPHLHVQIILDMEGNRGDYPGVCKFSEKEKYALNCPDPAQILNIPGLVPGE